MTYAIYYIMVAITAVRHITHMVQNVDTLG